MGDTLRLSEAPSSVLTDLLEKLPADSNDAGRYRRELARRAYERDEIIDLRRAAAILGIPARVLWRYGDMGVIRPADRYLGDQRFWRREIERWAAWIAGGGDHAS